MTVECNPASTAEVCVSKCHVLKLQQLKTCVGDLVGNVLGEVADDVVADVIVADDVVADVIGDAVDVVVSDAVWPVIGARGRRGSG